MTDPPPIKRPPKSPPKNISQAMETLCTVNEEDSENLFLVPDGAAIFEPLADKNNEPIELLRDAIEPPWKRPGLEPFVAPDEDDDEGTDGAPDEGASCDFSMACNAELRSDAGGWIRHLRLREAEDLDVDLDDAVALSRVSQRAFHKASATRSAAAADQDLDDAVALRISSSPRPPDGGLQDRLLDEAVVVTHGSTAGGAHGPEAAPSLDGGGVGPPTLDDGDASSGGGLPGLPGLLDAASSGGDRHHQYPISIVSTMPRGSSHDPEPALSERASFADTGAVDITLDEGEVAHDSGSCGPLSTRGSGVGSEGRNGGISPVDVQELPGREDHSAVNQLGGSEEHPSKKGDDDEESITSVVSAASQTSMGGTSVAACDGESDRGGTGRGESVRASLAGDELGRGEVLGGGTSGGVKSPNSQGSNGQIAEEPPKNFAKTETLEDVVGGRVGRCSERLSRSASFGAQDGAQVGVSGLFGFHQCLSAMSADDW